MIFNEMAIFVKMNFHFESLAKFRAIFLFLFFFLKKSSEVEPYSNENLSRMSTNVLFYLFFQILKNR